MKVTHRKTLLLLVFLLVMLITSLGMYYSHDVSQLRTLYPMIKIVGKEVSYPLSKKRPKHWVSLKDISPYLKGAIILSEDWSFYQHDGVDYEQLKKALGEITGPKKLRGASTITQQMVKNILLSSERSLWRKLHEFILANRVEQELSKDRILELYLNSIEYGPGIYGIKRAAQHYFHKSTAELNPRESAFIAMMLPSPVRYYASFRMKELTPFAQKRIEEILTKMRMGKIISPELYEQQLHSRFHWEKLDQEVSQGNSLNADK